MNQMTIETDRAVAELFASTNKASPTHLPIESLVPFERHPYQVKEDESMEALSESIRQYGVLTPILVRPLEDHYEIISGHRRVFACRKVGLSSVPCIIRSLSRDEAILAMVDSNLHREKLLPSEKAFAYKMKMDALRRQGQRTDLTSSPEEPKLRSDEMIGKEADESRATVQRYLRLTKLIPELLQMVDEGKIALSPASEVAGLSKESQKELLELMELEDHTPSLSQAIRMRKAEEEGKIDQDLLLEIITESKPNQTEKVSFKYQEIQPYFPKSYTPKQIKEIVISLLQNWKVKREHERERDER